jgi:hypothetical protein
VIACVVTPDGTRTTVRPASDSAEGCGVEKIKKIDLYACCPRTHFFVPRTQSSHTHQTHTTSQARQGASTPVALTPRPCVLLFEFENTLSPHHHHYRTAHHNR